MEQIKWGIIGCGDVTEIKSGPAFNKVANSKLVSVMRRDAEKCRDYAERHAVEKWHTDAAQLFTDPGINAIYIATPPNMHETYTLAALEAGKNVYVEKPMSLHAKSAQLMTDKAKEKKLKLCVAHYRRQQPFFKKIKELTTDGSIGEVRTVELQMHLYLHNEEQLKTERVAWRVSPEIAGGGIFHDLAPHQLDILYHLFGDAKKVSGYATNQAGAYAAHDAVAGIIQFRKNILFSGSWSFNIIEGKPIDECIITGSHGRIRFHFFNNRFIYLEKKDEEKVFEFDLLAHVQQPMIEAVVKYFSGETDVNPSPGEDAVVTMGWMDIMSNDE